MSELAALPQPDATVAGKYRIERTLGSGGPVLRTSVIGVAPVRSAKRASASTLARWAAGAVLASLGVLGVGGHGHTADADAPSVVAQAALVSLPPTAAAVHTTAAQDSDRAANESGPARRAMAPEPASAAVRKPSPSAPLRRTTAPRIRVVGGPAAVSPDEDPLHMELL